MTVRTRIICVKSGNGLVVSPSGSIVVEQKRVESVIFSKYLTNTGLSTGSYQMAITTGTLAAPVKFYIKSDNYDILITRLKFFISGVLATLTEFGTGTALTNGCRLFYVANDGSEVDINPIIKSNYDLVRLGAGTPAFGTGTAAFQVSNAVGTAEAYHPVVTFTDFMPNGKGILLKANSNQKLVIEIRDDTLTSRAVDFNCIADGEVIYG